nr:hypothetical protein [Tanacetum cinerariifolium]
VILKTSVSRPQLKSNPMGDRVLRSNSHGKKLAVEEHRRNVRLSKNKTSVTACNDSLNTKTLNVKSVSALCDKCVLIDKHAMCVFKSVAKPLKKTVASESNKKARNFTRKIYEHVSKACSWWYSKSTPSGYIWKPKSGKENVNPNLIEIVLFIVDSGCSKHMTGNLKLLINFVEKFLGTVKFRNDQIAPILGYGDLVQGAVTIKRVYYVEGLNHNLFSVGSRGTDLYSITLQGTNSPNPICLMAKATSDGENLDKMKEKGDECIFVGYSTQSRAYSVFNKRTRLIMESIHVNFDELSQMASAHNSSDPAPTCQNMASVQISSNPAPECQTMTLEHNSLSPGRICPENVSHGDKTDDEFINIFSIPVQDQGETSSRHVDSSNMHTFYQRYPSEQR